MVVQTELEEGVALDGIMAVSRAVAEGKALDDTLTEIARTAALLAGAKAAAIVLRDGESTNGLAVAGAYGLSEEYASELNRIRPMELGRGASGLAAATGRPVEIADVFTDPVFAPWRNLAEREGYCAFVSVPLRLGNGARVIGVLNVYRGSPGPWSRAHVALLMSLADHAAIAIQTAQLLDESRRQVRGLSLVVRSLRTQGHEHANLVHALTGLLAIGEHEEARKLIASADERYRSTAAEVGEGIENAVVSGFLLTEAVIAGNAGIELRVDRRSRLRTTPARLSDLDVITVLGNLVHNAVEAVDAMPASRRRVSVLVSDRHGALLMRVRDWGPGIPEAIAAEMFRPGWSTKPDHVGVGLAVARSVVQRAGGALTVERHAPGVALTASVPL